MSTQVWPLLAEQGVATAADIVCQRTRRMLTNAYWRNWDELVGSEIRQGNLQLDVELTRDAVQARLLRVKKTQVSQPA